MIGQNGDVAQTFLFDGFVAGTWSARDGRLVIEPFRKLTRPQQDDVAAESARLETLLAE